MITYTKVAVVTGANKGIGWAVVKGLCEKFNGIVYLTCRDISRGKAAVAELEKLGFHPEFHQLDITDQESVKTFKKHLEETYGGLDVLINNAAIAYKFESTDPFWLQAEETIEVDYFCLARVCNSLFPLLRSNARVVNVSSSAGHLSRIPNENIRKRLGDFNITEEQIADIMREFIESAWRGKHLQEGWGHSAYNIAKAGVAALTQVQQKKFDAFNGVSGVWINAVHTGFVNTDMTSRRGAMTIEQGADSTLYAALLPPLFTTPKHNNGNNNNNDDNNVIKGAYIWFNRTLVDWRASHTPTRV